MPSTADSAPDPDQRGSSRRSKQMDHRGWRSKDIDITWPGRGSPRGWPALRPHLAGGEAAIDEGYSLVVLSDRMAGQDRVPVSALLAVRRGAPSSGAHRASARGSASCRDRRGARGAPPLPAGRIRRRCDQSVSGVRGPLARRRLGTLDAETFPTMTASSPPTARRSPRACSRSWRRWGSRRCSPTRARRFSKRSASTVRSSIVVSPARPAAFRALASTSSRKSCRAASIGYPTDERAGSAAAERRAVPLARHGERHMWNPETIANLQVAARGEQRDAYQKFREHANNSTRDRCTLRGLLRFKTGNEHSAERGRAGAGHREALLHRRDELSARSRGSALDAGRRDEPLGRQIQHGRGRRRSGTLQASAERR